jgi:hypothetical protein
MLTIAVLILLICWIGLQAWRISDQRHANRVWNNLAAQAPADSVAFDPSTVQDLPEPARRFFQFTIRLGTPLRYVAEIRMSGAIGLGDNENPNYVPMRGHQIIAPPHGLVWKLDAGQGAMRISGSDGFDASKSWVRFWLLKFIPMVRAGGGPDHARSAFGRVVAEAVFFTPATLLPKSGVTWEAVGPDQARAAITFKGMRQAADITVAGDGRPLEVVIRRWSNANPDKTYRLQPFGGFLSEFREFDGYMLPTRIEGGNFIGTEDYFPFSKANVEDIRFLPVPAMKSRQPTTRGTDDQAR